MIPCSSGVFIGVDNYTHLPYESQLSSARASANKISSYFETAKPSGKWTAIVDYGDQLLVRSQIIEEIVNWIPTINEGSAGLLYFAGHGISTTAGWVFCPRDFRPNIAFDSGIPIRRIFDIITELGHKDSTYILMLDACRTGKNQINIDNIPANTFVIYSCTEENIAVESARSSIFVETFLESLENTERTVFENTDYARLHSVCDIMKVAGSRIPGSSFQQCDYSGSAEAVFVPLCSQQVYNTEAMPTVYMETRSLDERFLLSAKEALRQSLRNLGQTPQYVNSAVQEKTWLGSFGKLTIKLPPFSVLYPPSALVNTILSHCHSIFECITISWPIAIENNRFKKLLSALPGDTTPINGMQLLFKWRNNNYTGKIIVSHKNKTSAQISCLSPDADLMSLEKLVPTLGPVYDSLCKLHNNL